MEAVCLKCGNRGFPETLVFCNECQAYPLHRYCLDGPVIFREEVTWFCEDCEAKLVEPSSRGQSIPVSSETSDSISLANNAIKARREQRNCINRVKESNQQAHKMIKEEKQMKRKASPGLITKTKALLADSHQLPHLDHTQCSKSCDEGSKFKNECGPLPRDADNSNVGSESVQVFLVATSDDLNCVELDHYVYAQPIANPIWRGSFNFCNETIGIVTGLLAHMSSLACSKVLEETVLLPEVLCADLLPRSVVWPKSFKNRGPTDQCIALYFFPETERDEKAFDKLIDDIIQLELAMRVVAENAELLIFPSTALPMKHRRFQAKYYLWGVFKGKQTSHKTNDAVCRADAGVDKLLTRSNHSLSNTLSNSGSYYSNA